MRRIPFIDDWETRPHASFFLEMVGASGPWQPVTLPHDATLTASRAIPSTAQRRATSRAACTSTGRRSQRREEWRDRVVSLEFEGVYRSAVVYVNGESRRAVGHRLHRLRGRRSTTICGTARTTRCASCAARTTTPAGTPAPESTGRSTWSSGRSPTRARRRPGHDGGRRCGVSPSSRSRRRSRTTAAASRDARRRHRVRGPPTGRSVATATSPVTVLPGEPAVVRQRVVVREPARWSPDSPALYTASVELPAGRRRRSSTTTP